ncbi:hypothetical protein V8E36_003185, partial [Tilletia maclaganii]
MTVKAPLLDGGTGTACMYAGRVGGQGPGVDDNGKQSPMSSSTPECIHVFTWLFTRISLALASAALPLCSPFFIPRRPQIHLSVVTFGRPHRPQGHMRKDEVSAVSVLPLIDLSKVHSSTAIYKGTSRSPQAPGKPQVRLTLFSRLQPWSGDADAVLRECPHGAHRHRLHSHDHTCDLLRIYSPSLCAHV